MKIKITNKILVISALFVLILAGSLVATKVLTDPLGVYHNKMTGVSFKYPKKLVKIDNSGKYGGLVTFVSKTTQAENGRPNYFVSLEVSGVDQYTGSVDDYINEMVKQNKTLKEQGRDAPDLALDSTIFPINKDSQRFFVKNHFTAPHCIFIATYPIKKSSTELIIHTLTFESEVLSSVCDDEETWKNPIFSEDFMPVIGMITGTIEIER